MHPSSTEMNAHSMHLMSGANMAASIDKMMSTTSETPMDCCDNECVCPDNACTSVTLVLNSLNLLIVNPLSEKPLFLNLKKPTTQSKSLYRPPIFG
ncbi:hypothetical protein [Thalassotalea insulae]|nr:hypothetical protein [Thalassotalea insulae]